MSNRYSPLKIIILTTLLYISLVSTVVSQVGAIARGYLTNDNALQVGMVAALSTDDSENGLVERATQDNQERAIGIVTTVEDALITVASKNSKVLVENEGEVEAYVSDVGGVVKKGDLLTLSPLRGVLMRADASSPTIFGVSNSDLIISASEKYTFTNSPINTAHISRLSINLNRRVTGNSGPTTDATLTKIGRAIVGKDVGELRVIIALIIFFIVLIAEGGILYGAISSAIMALGRNPLAGRVIRRELVRVVLVALCVLGVGLISIYGILWV